MAKHKITGKGECPKCGEETEERQHIALTERQIKAPFFYSKWYYCRNKKCQTTMIMHEKDRIYNRNKAARQYKLVKEDKENQQRILNL